MVLSYEKDYPDGMCAKNDPSTLLLNNEEKPDWRRGFLIPFGTAVCFTFYPAVKNWATEVPIRTGIIRYPISFAVGLVIGKLFDDYRTSQLALEDAHYRQYIRNHPDDFQPAERKKVGDLLKPWVPIR